MDYFNLCSKSIELKSGKSHLCTLQYYVPPGLTQFVFCVYVPNRPQHLGLCIYDRNLCLVIEDLIENITETGVRGAEREGSQVEKFNSSMTSLWQPYFVLF